VSDRLRFHLYLKAEIRLIYLELMVSSDVIKELTKFGSEGNDRVDRLAATVRSGISCQQCLQNQYTRSWRTCRSIIPEQQGQVFMTTSF
jgi:hypothetical protein